MRGGEVDRQARFADAGFAHDDDGAARRPCRFERGELGVAADERQRLRQACARRRCRSRAGWTRRRGLPSPAPANLASGGGLAPAWSLPLRTDRGERVGLGHRHEPQLVAQARPCTRRTGRAPPRAGRARRAGASRRGDAVPASGSSASSVSMRSSAAARWPAASSAVAERRSASRRRSARPARSRSSQASKASASTSAKSDANGPCQSASASSARPAATARSNSTASTVTRSPRRRASPSTATASGAISRSRPSSRRRLRRAVGSSMSGHSSAAMRAARQRRRVACQRDQKGDRPADRQHDGGAVARERRRAEQGQSQHLAPIMPAGDVARERVVRAHQVR